MGLTREGLQRLLEGDEPPLDWEHDTIHELAAALAAHGTTAEAALMRLDTNGDGEISLGELRAWMGRLGLGLSARRVALLLRAMDLDGDGALQLDELLAVLLPAKTMLPATTSRGMDAHLAAKTKTSRGMDGGARARASPGAGAAGRGEERWARVRRLKVAAE